MALLAVVWAATGLSPAVAAPDGKPALAQEASKPEPRPEEQADKPKAELSGFGQFDYRRTSGDEAGATPRHEVSGRRIRLGVSGNATSRLSYAFLVQGDGLNANSASVLEASATVRLASWVRLQAGQFKYDFDLVGRESASLLTLSDRPFVTQALAGGLNGASTPASPSASFRDRGLSFAGERAAGRVAYALGAFQGNGRASDNNSAFAWVARAQGVPVRGLRLSAGLLDSDTRDEGKAGPGHYRAWTLGASFERGPLFLRGEYYAARRTRSDGAVSPDGFYVEAIRTLRHAFELLARYQRYEDPDVTAAGAIRSVDFGGRYFIARRGGRAGSSILANLLLRHAPEGPLKGLTFLNDGRGAAVTSGVDIDPVFVLRLQVQF